MAGGKVSSRQKMINLMYLVFIAMIALNMSKEVLSSFGYQNERLVESNERAIVNSQVILDNLALKASEQPEKYQESYEIASEINESSDSFYLFIEGLKNQLLEGVEDPTDYEKMDKTDPGDNLFFEGDAYTEEGNAFLKNMEGYKTSLIASLGDSASEQIVKDVEKRFNTDDVKVEGGKEPWLKNRYEGFPLISTLTNLSAIQSDIISSEREVFNSMLSDQLELDAGISADTYGAIFMPDKPAFIQGEKITGKIVLGRYDASLKPEKVVVNDQVMTGNENGASLVSLTGGRLGENKLSGEFVFLQKGESVSIPIDASYLVVAKPSGAVVSADAMNVVYRGISNPITISIPGVANNAVKASAPGLRKVKGNTYNLTPGKGREVVINVSGTMSNGEPVSDKQKFRIKDIPAPMASIRNEVGVIRMPKSSLSKATISAQLIDFVFDVNIVTTGFKIKIPGQSTVVVNGSRLDSKAQKALSKARRGDIITIFDVKAKLKNNSSYRLKNVMPLNVELSN
jgi:gliding motility-associated protein GldM